MGFLVFTCIDPVSSFLVCIPLSWSLVAMAALVVAIAGYTYYEASYYFPELAVLGFINYTVYGIIELAIALLIFVAFLVKKKTYSLIIYFTTLAFAGLGLALNIYKLSIFDLEPSIDGDNERKFIQWLYFIRIGAEFLAEMLVCYMVYSLKCSL